ncbi:MAG: hypothetical protein DWQ05_20810 [Calditrichaeota bacterium]|nr:MAG: hypothetical protein DWQ05_20810 [Calditrichota bacterium]
MLHPVMPLLVRSELMIRDKLAEFERAKNADLARDAEGHLTFLASSQWCLEFEAEKWPDVVFHKISEHN